MESKESHKSKCICIIPARGGSKRVKNKNIKECNGKPLLYHTIIKARESGIFSSIIVNSENDEILNIGRHYGAEVYRRPAELSGDNILLIDVIKEMLSALNLKDDVAVGIMLATSPLRNVTDIKDACEIFFKNDIKTPVVSVTQYERPIHLALAISEDNRLVPVFPGEYLRTTRSQEHTMAFWYNGAIIFNTVMQLKKQENLIGTEPVPYIMPFERSIDIDHEFQFEYVKFLLNKDNKKENI